jgi:hypothetical protein
VSNIRTPRRAPVRAVAAARPAAAFALAPALVLALALAALFLATVLRPARVEAHADGSYPRIFNVDWSNDPNARLNSRYDMVTLSPRALPAKFDSLQALNPAQKTLISPAFYAYYNAGPSEYPVTAGPWAPDDPHYGWDRRYWDLLEENQFWCWGVDSAGTRVHASPYWGMWFANFSSKCPPNAQGKRLCDVFADMVIDDLIASKGGSIDGVFFDHLWDGPGWLHWRMGGCAPGPTCTEQTPGTNWNAGFDLDADGVADHVDSLKVWWSAGVATVFRRFRERMGPDFVILGNGQHHFTDANGAFHERFPTIHGALDPAPNPWNFRWNAAMNGFNGYLTAWPTQFSAPFRAILDAELAGGDRWYYPNTPTHQSLFRFTLGSALLGDGYYGLNNGSYTCYYWQPEYELRLGWPTGPATPVTQGGVTVWTRNYNNGVVWVNPTSYAVPAGESNPAIPPYDALIQQTGGPIGPGDGPTAAIALAAPRPNPFVEGPATLSYALASGEDASLSIVDLRGRTVRRLWSGTGTGGAQTAFWDGRDDRGATVPAGVYFARLSGEAGRSAKQKLVRAR